MATNHIHNRQQSTHNCQPTSDNSQQITVNTQQTTDNGQQITDNTQQTTDNMCQHQQLTPFFIRSIKDPMIKPTHISLYLALFQFWLHNGFKNPLNIDKKEVMQVSKIQSKVTYYKCMHDLHNKGYINYLPSNNPFKSSMVYILFKDAAS